MSSTLLTFRRVILTVGITGIAATGAILGAQLKETQQVAKRHEEIKRATSDEIIASLRARIQELQHTRSGILSKIETLDREVAMKAKERGTG